MKGLELSRQYFNEIARESLHARFGGDIGLLAAGLIGAGSECFGYDDEISQDHDWGPGFLVFIKDDAYTRLAPDVEEWYAGLPKTFRGCGPRRVTEGGRVGPVQLGRFFAMYTGLKTQTPTPRQWLLANTEGLALTANGEVFLDTGRILTDWRTALGAYPEDVRRKKIACDCFLAGQSGQYNYVRSSKRGDVFAAGFALTQFCSRALSLAFLLCGRFAPFYKWKLRAALDLPEPYAGIASGVRALMQPGAADTQDRIEALAAQIILHLAAQGLAQSGSDFLADYKPLVEQSIRDDEIKNMPGLY